MRFGRSIMLFGLCLWVVALTAFAMGLSAGVEAGSVGDATASFDGQTFTVGGESTDIDYARAGERLEPAGPVESALYEYTPLDRPVSHGSGPLAAAVRSFVNGVLWGAFHIAALTGSLGGIVGYYAPAMLVPALSLAVQGAAYLSVGGAMLYELQRVRRVVA